MRGTQLKVKQNSWLEPNTNVDNTLCVALGVGDMIVAAVTAEYLILVVHVLVAAVVVLLIWFLLLRVLYDCMSVAVGIAVMVVAVLILMSRRATSSELRAGSPKQI